VTLSSCEPAIGRKFGTTVRKLLQALAIHDVGVDWPIGLDLELHDPPPRSMILEPKMRIRSDVC